VVTDPETGFPHVRVHRGFSNSTIETANMLLTRLAPEGFMNRVDVFVAEDAANDSRTLHDVVDPEGIAAYVDLPISIANQVFGIFNLSFTDQRRFTDDDRRLFAALAQRAAVAIENARLFGRAQRAAGLEERQRLARELHDSVSQALYGIALGARTAKAQLERDPARAGEPLDYVLTLAEAGLAELRSLIFELRPESLETEGLVAAFQKQFAAIRARHGISVHPQLGDEPDAPIAVKEAIYRIGQEALNNTVKHARATSVRVALSAANGRITLEIGDDGRGFDPESDFPGHLGLQTMAERARELGGSLAITSTPGEGTTVRLDAPLGPRP
jgi:signal transduction histidine kinase